MPWLERAGDIDHALELGNRMGAIGFVGRSQIEHVVPGEKFGGMDGKGNRQRRIEPGAQVFVHVLVGQVIFEERQRRRSSIAR
jgi:hypothetical protein